MQPQACLDNQAKRPFRPGKQMGEVIPRGGLARARSRRNDTTIGCHHFQPHDSVAHAAVADGGRPRSTRRNHAAERGIGTGIDGEKQPGGADVFVQLLAGHAGFDDAQKIGGADVEDACHAAEIHAKTVGVGYRRIALQRRSGAIGDDRPVFFGGCFHQQLYIFDRLGLRNQRRRSMGVMTFALGILRPRRSCGDKARTKSVSKCVYKPVHIVSPTLIAALHPSVNWYYIGII